MLEATGKVVDVQSIVEQPHIYIFAHCTDSISEKLSYIMLRGEDILAMKEPITIDKVELHDTMRFFQGLLINFTNVPHFNLQIKFKISLFSKTDLILYEFSTL